MNSVTKFIEIQTVETATILSEGLDNKAKTKKARMDKLEGDLNEVK